LMISAFAKGCSVLGEKAYLEAAQRATSFLMNTMYNAESGRLLRRFCDGEPAIPGFLDDYAFLAQALLDVFEAGFDVSYLESALDLAGRGLEQFEDREQGGFFSTVENAADLLLRMKDDYDGAEPSGNSLATDVLLRLAHLTGDQIFRERAERSLECFAPKIKGQPTIAPQMLVALGRWLTEPAEIVIRCEAIDSEIEEMIAQRRQVFSPDAITIAISDAAAERLKPIAPFLGGLERKGRITVYECRNFTCELPKVID
ncbi:MAG: thioredoxin domain-containing protein, partial [Bryobacteraceae bacterium]